MDPLDPKSGPEVKVHCEQRPRRPVTVSTGVHVQGASLPKPDLGDPTTALAGACKRIFAKLPPADRLLRQKFQLFVRCKVREMFDRISRQDLLLGFEEWVDQTSYTEKRKEELRLINYSIIDPHNPKYAIVKSFIKDETYPSFKHARTINSRSDEFKCIVGPIFKCIEREVFKNPYFIKKVPMDDRPQYIYDHVYQHGATMINTDYTSYESSFDRESMWSCERELYDYLTQDLNEHADFMSQFDTVIMGKQTMKFKNFTILMDSIRMSGEMNTSLGNGFSNLMTFLFACQENGCSSPKGVVEGDDGLCSFYGNIPVDFYARLGFVIKLETVDKLSEASFCGLVFDEKDRVVLCDPIKVLLNFGWADRKYIGSSRKRMLELIRSKSLSILWQYSGCPIITSLAAYGLRMTRGITVRWNTLPLNVYERERLLLLQEKYGTSTAPIKPVGDGSRLLVEKKFGISIADQIAYEQRVDSLTKLSPLVMGELESYISSHAKTYDLNYVKSVDVRSEFLDKPLIMCSHVSKTVLDLQSECPGVKFRLRALH